LTLEYPLPDLTFFLIGAAVSPKSTPKTNQIIVPSNYWRDFLIKKYHLNKKRVVTTYEAVDSFFLKENKNTTSKASNYLIYTGNLYPHKNIEVLLLALKKLPHLKLKIISARNYFTQKISKKIKELKLQKQVEILGYIDDHQFIKIYKNALALVHPSLMEGFSLTGLEAMALNCPVISSNASCLPEIYGNSVLYFDPYNTNDLVKKINQLKNSNVLRQRLIKLGQKQVKKYSWDTCAKESMAVYQKLL
jgi:glycosyltransferase involved in cell wall biosynthesis